MKSEYLRQVEEMCAVLYAANTNIEALEAQIEAIKAPAEAPVEEVEEPAPILERHCPQCGAVVPEEAKFCNNCGAQL